MNKKIRSAIMFLKKHQIYGDFYNNINDNSKFTDLPYLTSVQIKDANTNQDLGSYTTYFTSGTTSKPKAILYTKKDFTQINKYLKWFNKVEGIKEKERVLVFMDQFFWGIGHLTYRGHLEAGNCVVPVDTDLPKHAMRIIVDSVKPTMISSLPSILIENMDVLTSNTIKKIETTGEILSLNDRLIIENGYKAEVYDSYGLTESLVGVECDYHDGYHYDPKFVRIDVINKDCLDVKENETGELIVTSFFHELMPIIKYRTGDLGFKLTEKCKCRLNYPRVKIIGRIKKGYELDEGYEVMHDDLEKIVKGVYKDGLIRNIEVTKSPGWYSLKIYTENLDQTQKMEVKNKIEKLNQELVFMIKRNKLNIEIK